MPLIDIRPDHWEIVRDILHKHVPQYEVWAFGSRAKWTAKPYSDLDLAIITDARLSSSVMAALADDFSESDLPWKVDVVDWAATSEVFQKIIERDKVVVQKAAAADDYPSMVSFRNAPLEIIDGDRGTNYPSQDDFLPAGYCLFLNAGNVTKLGFDFSNCAFISKEKDASLRKGRLKRYDVILTTRGTVGNTAYFGDEVPFNQIRINSGMVILRADESTLDSRYLYFFVRSLLFTSQVSGLQTGSAQPQLPIRDINRVCIPIPQMETQRAIASTLGALDDKIGLNSRMNETLEVMARAIFKDWFVDFGPTRAKMAAAEPYLAPEIWNLFPHRLDDEGKPEGWERGRIGDYTELQNGFAFKSSDWKERGVPVVKIGSVKPAVVDLTQISYVSEILAEERSAFRLNVGDVLVGLTGYVGETGRIPPTDNPPLLNQRVGRFSTSGHFSPFVFSCVRDPAFKVFAEGKGHGSAQANVSTKDLLTYPVIKTDRKTLAAYEEIVAPLYEKSLSNLGEMNTLAATRDFLLPKLMSGEIRVRDMEKIGEAALELHL